MDELKELILGMQKNIDYKFTAIESQMSQMEEKISANVNSHMNQKFEDLKNNLHEIRSQLDKQETRLYYLEKSSVERNLVFFGVRENEQSYFDLQNNILDIINKKMRVPIQALEIQSLKRLGKKGLKPRPVSIAFTTLGTKINILKNKKFLQGSEIHITPEFPPAILEKRKALKTQLQSELEKGNTAYIKYDKLVVKGKITYNIHKKRQLSPSPTQGTSAAEVKNLNESSMTRSYNNSKNYHTSKKHRTNKNTMHAYMTHDVDA